MRRVNLPAVLSAAALLSATLYQGCAVALTDPETGGTIVIPVPDSFPHFDGDGSDSPLDRLFGFDDDDD